MNQTTNASETPTCWECAIAGSGSCPEHNVSETPETDEISIGHHCRIVDHAKTLERQRNEARALCDTLGRALEEIAIRSQLCLDHPTLRLPENVADTVRPAIESYQAWKEKK